MAHLGKEPFQCSAQGKKPEWRGFRENGRTDSEEVGTGKSSKELCCEWKDVKWQLEGELGLENYSLSSSSSVTRGFPLCLETFTGIFLQNEFRRSGSTLESWGTQTLSVWGGEGKPAEGAEVSVSGRKRREVPVQLELKGGFCWRVGWAGLWRPQFPLSEDVWPSYAHVPAQL